MPTTVNGISTHYYGRSNLSRRSAPCEFCRRVGNLESYDTRLWFVVIFIPVIPLGRKRIIDQCPRCRMHRAADSAAYEHARELQTNESIDQFHRAPSPEGALLAHGRLLAYLEDDRAAEFRESALKEFPEDAGLRVGLAGQLRQMSAFDEAALLNEDALKIDPNLPEARVGVAFRKMAVGELDQARGLLDFLQAPGAGLRHPLGPLDVLSGHYQRQGRHEEALDLAAILLRELPEAGRKPAFRSFVRKSEKALDRWETILPPKEHSLRGLFRGEGPRFPVWLRVALGLVIVPALVLAVVFGSNEYIRQHRTVHVVNATGKPVHIRVDGRPSQKVGSMGKLVVAEGKHRVRISGPVQDDLEIEMRTGFLERWTARPLWVLNPGGEAVIEKINLYYSTNPMNDNYLIVGKPFHVFSDVDYPFEEPPPTLRVQNPRETVRKTWVRWVEDQDAAAFLKIDSSASDDGINFAERRLRRDPGQLELFKAYFKATDAKRWARVEAFLKVGLDRRPVLVQWHRAYQIMAKVEHRDEALVAFYDQALKAEPANGALLYLRGRVEPDWKRQEAYYRRAIEADPKLPWPWVGLAVRDMGAARWDDVSRSLYKANMLKIDKDEVSELMQATRMATGDALGLVRDYHAFLAADPNHADIMSFYCDALVESDQADQVPSEIDDWVKRLPASTRQAFEKTIRALALYQAGEFRRCELYCRRDNYELPSIAMRAQALLALGRAREAAADESFTRVWAEPWSALALSLGLSLEGQPDEADRWREQACRTLDTRINELRRVAVVLRAAGPTPMAELDQMLIDPDQKALLLAILSFRFPGHRDEYLAAAARFNVGWRPPSHLVRRAIEGEAVAIP